MTWQTGGPAMGPAPWPPGPAVPQPGAVVGLPLGYPGSPPPAYGGPAYGQPDYGQPAYGGPPAALPAGTIPVGGGAPLAPLTATVETHMNSMLHPDLQANGALNNALPLAQSRYVKSRRTGNVLAWSQCFAALGDEFANCDADGREDPAAWAMDVIDDLARAAPAGPMPPATASG
ncbi:MAG: hypothetical protein LBL95_01365, partial [Deltaproteobacteria bacterium]|nr:hypothetical protein [Deltaproteobacteria bacterium]